MDKGLFGTWGKAQQNSIWLNNMMIHHAILAVPGVAPFIGQAQLC